jgi:hypothetical protein
MHNIFSWFLKLARWLTRLKAWIMGFDRVIRSTLCFFIIQNDVILVKKNIQQVVTGLPGQPSFFFLLFFLKPGPILALGQFGLRSTSRAEPGFKTMI